MANHMAEVAKMLGVELGERFKLVDTDFQYAFDFDERPSHTRDFSRE